MHQPRERRPKPYRPAKMDEDSDAELQEALRESRKDQRTRARQSRAIQPVRRRLPTEDPRSRAEGAASQGDSDAAAPLEEIVTHRGLRPKERPAVHEPATRDRAPLNFPSTPQDRQPRTTPLIWKRWLVGNGGERAKSPTTTVHKAAARDIVQAKPPPTKYGQDRLLSQCAG